MINTITTEGLYPYTIEIDTLNNKVKISAKGLPHIVYVSLTEWYEQLEISSHITRLSSDECQAANFLWWRNLHK